MPRRLRNIVMVLLLAVRCGPLFAAVSATAKLTVSGAEQQPNGVWDSGSITVSFNGFSETVSYAQFSNNSSLASALAATFTRDFNRYGLWAKAGANNNTDPTVVTFQLTNGDAFGSISYSLPSTSFALTPSGFASPGPVVADSGTVTLQVNGTMVASAHYTDGSTPTSIAQSLADAASSSLVSAQADGNLLYLISKQTGSAVNYPYSITITPATNTFPNPSFTVSPMSDTMSGGANASSSTGPIYSYSITNSSNGSGYDHAGNILNLTDSVMGTWSYGYDNLNRLVSGHATSGTYAVPSPYLCWSYDSFGNRTHQSLSNQAFVNATGSACQTASGASLVDTSTVPGTNNRISSETPAGSSTVFTPIYDAAGNVTNDGVNTYLYDAEERVCAVHGVYGMTGYQYDAAGQRVGKGSITSMSCDITANGYQPTNDYVLDQSGAQMTELAVDENGTVAWQHTNVMAEGKLIATYDPSGLHFYLNDVLGTRRAQTDSTGVLEQNCLSLPFGDQLNCTISISGPTEHHFTGKERDAESGLDYFGARYYASNIGRFTSPDKPFTDQHPKDPQSWNMYEYARNNPSVHFDSDGRACSGLNGNTGFCQRADMYDILNSRVAGKTVFYKAASAATQSLANVDVPGLGRLAVSKTTRDFLEHVGQSLETLNQRTSAMISSGQISLTGAALDFALVHREQNQVQVELDAFKRANPSGYDTAIKEINVLLNPDQRTSVQSGFGFFDKNLFGTDKAMDALLSGTKTELGHSINFANQNDREAAGDDLVRNIRATGGCSVTGDKITGCSH